MCHCTFSYPTRPAELSCISRKLLCNLERAKGFEPSTPTLARLCSTPELRPLWRWPGVAPAGKVGAAILGPPRLQAAITPWQAASANHIRHVISLRGRSVEIGRETCKARGCKYG